MLIQNIQVLTGLFSHTTIQVRFVFNLRLQQAYVAFVITYFYFLIESKNKFTHLPDLNYS